MNTDRTRLEKAEKRIKPGPTVPAVAEQHVLVMFGYAVYEERLRLFPLLISLTLSVLAQAHKHKQAFDQTHLFQFKNSASETKNAQ